MRVQGLRRKFYDVIPDWGIWPPGREKGVRKSKMCSKCFERHSQKSALQKIIARGVFVCKKTIYVFTRVFANWFSVSWERDAF